MAAAIPAPLKAADIARFAHRAGQLEKAKPVVAYYSYYWILDQIIEKRLHNTDNECKAYTTNLMDKLEQMKVDYAENNAIRDDMAGHAYIEQFGQETFQRAEKTMSANKVTRQTADTFQAAATFLDLGQIWGPLDPEIVAKIKFAKYHALRIAKALKAGEDPNLSNPIPEPDPEEVALLDPNDPEVQAINGTGTSQDPALQPSVEEVPDEHDQAQSYLAQPSVADDSLQDPSFGPQSAQPKSLSPPDQSEDYYAKSGAPDVPPLGALSADRNLSSGGGYFPSVPDGVGHAQNSLPNAIPLDPGSPPVQILPNSSTLPPSSTADRPEASLHSFPPPNIESTSNITSPPTISQPASYNAPNIQFQAARQRPGPLVQPNLGGIIPNPVQHPAPPSSAAILQHASRPAAPIATSSRVYETNEEAILKAQKHARWAISALNFEDVKTAVKELKGALESLGAD